MKQYCYISYKYDLLYLLLYLLYSNKCDIFQSNDDSVSSTNVVSKTHPNGYCMISSSIKVLVYYIIMLATWNKIFI